MDRKLNGGYHGLGKKESGEILLNVYTVSVCQEEKNYRDGWW